MVWSKLTAGAVFMMLMSHQLSAASAYTCTLVRYPNARNTVITSINNLRQAVGEWVDETGMRHGFLWNADGTFVPLTGPSGQGFLPTAINNVGQILGTAPSLPVSLPSGPAYIRNSNGSYTELIPPATPPDYIYERTSFTGLNDSGQVVGSILAHLESPTGRSSFIFVFIREPDGQYRIVDQSGTGTSPSITVGHINNAGIFIEQTRSSSGYLVNPDAAPELFKTPLTVPGLPFAFNSPSAAPQTHALNNSLFTVGAFGVGDAFGSFLRTPDGSFQSFWCPEVPEAFLYPPTAINDSNEIGGSASTRLPSGEVAQVGFIATPTGVVPHMVVCQRFVAFGTRTAVGPEASPEPAIARIWIGNLGPADLHVSTVYLTRRTETPISFQILDSNCARGFWPTTPVAFLPPWGDCYVDVGFIARGPGTQTATLYVIGDSPESPQVVHLSGEGGSE